MTGFQEALRDAAEAVQDKLDRILTQEDAPEARLMEAMRYAVLGGGKRIRPFLVLQSAGLFGVSQTVALRTAAALELVHCYSLVHDDLPAMDDDDLRRGRPTVHKKYDEATAILVGDALLTLAFEVLAHPDTHTNPSVRAALTLELARASGIHGMVGGQAIDLSAPGEALDIGGITRLQRLKTGRLIDFGLQSGAILGSASPSAREALRGYGHDLGLAFQIADDLLDVEGSEEEMGKAVGKDADQGKATFVSVLGAQKARDQAERLAEQAIQHLAIFDKKAEFLRDLARFVVERRY